MAQVEGVISPALAELLRKRRPEFNRRFEQQRQQCPGLDGPKFLKLFPGLAEAALRGIARQPSAAAAGQRADEVIAVLYRDLLEFMGQGLLGGTDDGPAAIRALQAVMEAYPAALGEDPDAFLRSSLNAILAIFGHGPGSLETWKEAMIRSAGAPMKLDAYLDAGLAAAWLAGLAQFRGAALDALPRLPRTSIAALFNMTSIDDENAYHQSIDRLRDDPWANPRDDARGAAPENLVFRTVGGFSGFGGPFGLPPRMAALDGQVFAVSGDDAFQVMADRWGVYCRQRSDVKTADCMVSQEAHPVFTDRSVEIRGKLHSLNGIKPLTADAVPAGLSVSSAVLAGNTLFCTSHLSYKVFILGLPAAGT